MKYILLLQCFIILLLCNYNINALQLNKKKYKTISNVVDRMLNDERNKPKNVIRRLEKQLDALNKRANLYTKQIKKSRQQAKKLSHLLKHAQKRISAIHGSIGGPSRFEETKSSTNVYSQDHTRAHTTGKAKTEDGTHESSKVNDPYWNVNGWNKYKLVTDGYKTRKSGMPKPYILPSYLMPVNPNA